MNNMIFIDWQAIEFAKEQDDEDLWDDLINYSLDKPGMSLFCMGAWVEPPHSVLLYAPTLISLFHHVHKTQKIIYIFTSFLSRDNHFGTWGKKQIF